MELLQTVLSEQTIQRIGWVLVHFLWQGVAVAALMWCVLKMLGKASSQTRYIAACAGLALMAAAPAVTFMMAAGEAPVAVVEMAVETPVTVSAAPAAAPTKTIVMAPAEPTALPAPTVWEVFTARLEAALPYCVIGWFVGVAVLSVWYLGGWCQLQKLRRIGTKAVTDTVRQVSSQLAERLGIRRAVGIVESALVQVPTVIGHFKPVVLLPASALTGLDEVQLTAMIAHELAHIKRCDYLVNIAQTVVEILGFYHPAVWWMSRQIRAERENCCDDIAVALLQNKKDYAGALFTMEAIRSKQLDLAVAANGGHLTNRISRLVGKPTQHQKSGWIPSTIILLLFVAGLVTVAIAMNEQTKMKALPTEQEMAKLLVGAWHALDSGDSAKIDDYFYFENSTIRQKALIYLKTELGDFSSFSDVHILDITVLPDGDYQVFTLNPMLSTAKDYIIYPRLVVFEEGRYKLKMCTQEYFDKQERIGHASPEEFTRIATEEDLNKWKNATGQTLDGLIQSKIQELERALAAIQYAKVHNLNLVPLDSEGINKRLDELRNTPPEQLRQEFIEEMSQAMDEASRPKSSEFSNSGKVQRSNLVYIGRACLVYAVDHGGKFPDRLEELVTECDLSPKYFVSPKAPDSFDGPGYILIQGLTDAADDHFVLAYENPEISEDKVSVLFVDGHVEEMDREALAKSLQETLDSLDTQQKRGWQMEAERTKRATKLRGVGVPIWVWANEHDDVFPDSIEQVEFENEGLKEWALENVEYLAAGKVFAEIEEPGKEVIAYDKNLSKTDAGTNLLFADGHVEFVKRQDIPRELNLRPEKPYLEGRVFGPDGAPIFGATVQIRQKRETGMIGIAAPDVKTDSDGYFWYDSIDWPYKVGALWETIENNGWDRYTQYVGENHYYDQPQMIDIHLDREFPKGDCSLHGKVIGPDGSPLKDFVVKIENLPDWKIEPPQKVHQYVLQKGFNNEQGSYEIKGLPEGIHRITVGSQTTAKEIDLGGGAMFIDKRYAEKSIALKTEKDIQCDFEPAQSVNFGGGMGGFGGMKVAEPNEAINYPRNWDEIVAKRAKKLGMDPNEYWTTMKKTAAKLEFDPNEMRTEIYDVSDVLSYNDTNRKPGENLEVLKQTVIQTIVPESWHENGGQGRLDLYSDGKLIIYQTPEVHETLRNRFKKFRDLFLKYQIAIETRIIFIDDLESLKTVQLPNSGQTVELDFLQPDHSIGQVIEGAANTEAVKKALEPKALSEKLVPPNAFQKLDDLDDLQASLLLRSVQAQPHAKMLTAPKVTVYNGENASITLITNRLEEPTDSKMPMFISEPIRPERSYTDIDGQTKTVKEGIFLDISGIVQPDGKRIMLKGHLLLSDILENRPIEHNGNAYDIPYMQVANIPVYAMVKSGGTILIAGPELTVTKEASGKSQIPYLSRGFSNRPQVTDKQRLIVLIKPTIIKQEEVTEEDAIGALAPRPDGGKM